MDLKVIHIVISLFLHTFVSAQEDGDYDELGRRLHRRRRPNRYGNGNPCGRNLDEDARFLSVQYVNLNYNYNCGGGGHYPQNSQHPQQDFIGGGGHGHRPQRPFKPNRPNRPFLNGLGGGGSHGGQQGPLYTLGQNTPGLLQDFANTAGGFLNRPTFQRPFGGNNDNGGGSSHNGGGLFGLGLFDGSIISSFGSLFRPSSNTPSSGSTPTTTVQYLEEQTNNNNNNNGGSENMVIVDEKPVHEDQDEVVEAYNNRNKYVSAYGSGGYGGFNRVIRRVNKEVVNTLYDLLRR